MGRNIVSVPRHRAAGLTDIVNTLSLGSEHTYGDSEPWGPSSDMGAEVAQGQRGVQILLFCRSRRKSLMAGRLAEGICGGSQPTLSAALATCA